MYKSLYDSTDKKMPDICCKGELKKSWAVFAFIVKTH